MSGQDSSGQAANWIGKSLTRWALLALAGLLALPLAGCASVQGQAPAILNLSLSGGAAGYSASVPDIAIDPHNPQRVAVIWRDLKMDRPGEPAGERGMTCHLSLSSDGGAHFTSRPLTWDRPDTPVCNAPYVDIGPGGELLIGATLAGVLPQNAPAGAHVPGRVVMRLSRDWGTSWSPLSTAIASGDETRFAANPEVPAAATHIPWDGARGVIDGKTGAITLSGGFPAPPGEDLHSQRFYSVSHDRGRSWGPIYAFAGPGWPQRWDGHMISAHGKLAVSYLAGAVPDPDVHCLCVVFATSADGGATLERHFVAAVTEFDTLVHYPPIAADPQRDGVYALALVAQGRGAPEIRLTQDAGVHWGAPIAPAAPAGVVRASRPAIAFTPDGDLALMWRGYYSDGSYDVFMAAAGRGRAFGPALRISTARSTVPESLLKDYSVRGDFINVIAAGPDAMHAAWTDWRSGSSGEVVYGRVPLALLLGRPAG